MHLASKQVNFGKIPYTSFLQNCMVFVNVGFPAFAKGDVKASLSFGCQLLLLTVFAFLVVNFTSNVGIAVFFWTELWTMPSVLSLQEDHLTFHYAGCSRAWLEGPCVWL